MKLFHLATAAISMALTVSLGSVSAATNSPPPPPPPQFN